MSLSLCPLAEVRLRSKDHGRVDFSGKSLCFQLPALIQDGVTLVVSPLISLMRDQVLNLQQAGIHAEVLSSATSKEDTKRISDILNGKVASESLKLVYVTPEKVSVIA